MKSGQNRLLSSFVANDEFREVIPILYPLRGVAKVYPIFFILIFVEKKLRMIILDDFWGNFRFCPISIFFDFGRDASSVPPPLPGGGG